MQNHTDVSVVAFARNALFIPLPAEDTLADLGDRLLVALRRPIVTAEGLVTASGSVGLAYVNGSDHTETDAVELVAAADAAMYRSKRRGRGSPVITREEV